MTKRLYYGDAYLRQFTARVVEQVTAGGQYHVLLDRTAFYPTSGGQPFDTGVLQGADKSVRVVDVWVRDTDDAIVHCLEAPLSDRSGAEFEQISVRGEIDWERRFDHMQHHTGQHVLSQAFMMVAQAETVSFHLSANSVTIDLAAPKPLSARELEEAEALANQIVWQDRTIQARTYSSNALDQLPLRKPPSVDEDIRVIQVADFDWSACGGTHVARTGEIGVIKVVKWEKQGQETRVEFLCGERALKDYGLKNRIVNDLAAGFNVGYWELDQAVERLVEEGKDLRSQLRAAGRSLAAYQAAELRAQAPTVEDVRVVVQKLEDRPLEEVRELARQLVSAPSVVALLGVGEDKAHFCFARSENVDLDMSALVRNTAATLGAPRGGGPPDFAQGGGPLTDVEQLDSALDWATREIYHQLEYGRE
jgi:alanyl-tRNA synthetase